MTNKENAVMKEIFDPGLRRAFPPASLEVEGLNKFQVNGVLSILDRKGIIERYDAASWVLTHYGVSKGWEINWDATI